MPKFSVIFLEIGAFIKIFTYFFVILVSILPKMIQKICSFYNLYKKMLQNGHICYTMGI